MQYYFKFLITLYTHLRHFKIEKKYRYYIRDNYFSNLYQSIYFFKDFINRNSYKVVDYQGEFQQELCFVLPFAYWHYLNGTLKTTIASTNTKELYFFSADHKEVYEKRIWEYNSKNFEFPNMTHSLRLSKRKWKRVPLKEQYHNTTFCFEKPILVIANKYNIEWNRQPLNFLDKPVLASIIDRVESKYQVIYNRPASDVIVTDNSEILDLQEVTWLRNVYPNVLLMEDLYSQYSSIINNFNHLQLLIYANCEHFISVHGGTAALCSYFKGTNIVYSKSGIEHLFNEFSNIFTELSGAKILHAKTSEQIIEYLNEF